MTSAARIQLTSMAEGTVLIAGTNRPAVGATAYIYQHLTTTQVSVYASETSGSVLSQPLVADSTGSCRAGSPGVRT